jgi:hypothetical protein
MCVNIYLSGLLSYMMKVVIYAISNATPSVESQQFPYDK